MPERVDFYLLKEAGQDHLLTCACRIAGKACLQGMRVYVRLESSQQVEMFDQLLWSFNPTSFVPHCVYSGGGKTDGTTDGMTDGMTPVVIGDGPGPEGYEQMLICLTATIPDDVDRYHRVADLISNEDQAKQFGRVRFKQYRSSGIEPSTHKI